MIAEVIDNVWFVLIILVAALGYSKKILEPGLRHNKATWNKLNQILSEDLLIELHYQIDQKREIRDSDLRKLRSFVDDIINDREYLRFSFPQRRTFEKRKQNIKNLFQQLVPLISHPIWSLENDQSYWSFNKNYFLKEFENGYDEYIHHLNNAAELMEFIRFEYRCMSILANLSILEFFTSKLIVKRRARLP